MAIADCTAVLLSWVFAAPTWAGPDGRSADASARVAKNRLLFGRCKSLAIKKQPLGQVFATLTIDKTGLVSKVGIEGIPKDDGGYAGCLTGLLRRWTFDSAASESTARIAIP